MFETSLCQILFYVLAALAVLCAAGVVGYRNPVNSAMCMAVCFAMLAVTKLLVRGKALKDDNDLFV